MEIGFLPGEILIPKKELIQNFAVVACDQFTSQPEYWRRVECRTRDAKATAYRMIFPEADLGKVDFASKIQEINHAMEQSLKEDVYDVYPDAMIYVERTLLNGSVRRGLVGLLDLEQYDYRPGSESLIRATEKTVEERLPPRIQIRENAPLELPHILILIDDPEKTVIEPVSKAAVSEKPVYDFDLMEQGGHISGFLVSKSQQTQVLDALSRLEEPKAFQQKYGISQKAVLLFAVGDGNHSLAAAKAVYQQKKEQLGEEALSLPCRYALVEIENVRDDALVFEPIHRVVFNVDPDRFCKELTAFCKTQEGEGASQRFTLLFGGTSKEITIPHPELTLTVGSVQRFLDAYTKAYGGEIDYVHGEEVVSALSQKPGTVGILLPAMEKGDLFKTVIAEGALPRKTFSMGEASEKRYYLECHKIK